MSHDRPITLINIFEVSAEHVETFIAQWRERAALMAGKPGFLDSRLHRAVPPQARFQLVNVAHWESQQAWQDATADAEFQRRIQAATADVPIAANPAAYRVAVEFVGPESGEERTSMGE